MEDEAAWKSRVFVWWLMTVVILGYSRRSASSVVLIILPPSCPHHSVEGLHLQADPTISEGDSEYAAATSASRSIFRDISSNSYKDALFSLTPLGDTEINPKRNGIRERDIDEDSTKYMRREFPLISFVGPSHPPPIQRALSSSIFYIAMAVSVFPICLLLCRSPPVNSQLVYMALFIFSKEEKFAKDIHEMPFARTG
ncbi:hypothetical protein ACTXT7_000711 [Hymenolepis weldensis]